uniref:mucin-binding protein n=1 Tax=Lacticaseibacillus sp. 866-1 TaxID=2799576 RepID=UPI0035B5062D
YTVVVPDGYVLVTPQKDVQDNKVNYTFTPGNDNKLIHLTHKTTDSTLTTTRTIVYEINGKKVDTPAPVVQDTTWTITTDMVTGAITAAKPKNNYAAVTTPALAGYIPDKKTVDEETPKLTLVSGSPVNETVFVNYTPEADELQVTYVEIDEFGNPRQDQLIKTEMVAGKTGELVSFTPTVPKGYIASNFVPGEPITYTLTPSADGLILYLYRDYGSGNGGGNPPTDNGGNPPTNNDGNPPTNNNGNPPTNNNGNPPTNNDGNPPTNNDGNPPMNNNGNPPTNNDGNPPTNNDGNPPTNNDGNPPTNNDGNPPTNNDGNPPTDNGGNPPTNNGGNPPTNNDGNPPTDNGGNPPTNNEGGNPPINGGGTTPGNPGDTPTNEGGNPTRLKLPRTDNETPTGNETPINNETPTGNGTPAGKTSNRRTLPKTGNESPQFSSQVQR